MQPLAPVGACAWPLAPAEEAWVLASSALDLQEKLHVHTCVATHLCVASAQALPKPHQFSTPLAPAPAKPLSAPAPSSMQPLWARLPVGWTAAALELVPGHKLLALIDPSADPLSDLAERH
eukprot:CAMPEP_0180661264 /NCGR_PEP_ID=MMETSP1037_2-20121125/58729_1 /TAXON_ID=632150 /ORGANISM="Azadinium spinosum, Strain 3D9" /LENGTH=120 /DNA_ID=CAMNT_0022688775 /DNA_START=188 /DNA_END=547 /DNA_ORIENTATION=-